MKRIAIIIAILISLLSVNRLYAQGEAAVPFLLLAPDSRAGGIGESGGGLADNSAAIFWNPAGIAFLSGSEISITHSNWLPQFNLDLFYDYLTYRQYIEEIGGSVTARARSSHSRLCGNQPIVYGCLCAGRHIIPH